MHITLQLLRLRTALGEGGEAEPDAIESSGSSFAELLEVFHVLFAVLLLYCGLEQALRASAPVKCHLIG